MGVNARQLKQIRRRFEEGLPLNINAVLRECPRLMESAYSGKKPQGWRNALLKAGVDPYAIVHEHLDVVACPVCGREMGVLGSHLVKAHGIERDMYEDEFGKGFLASSEAFRAGQFRGKPRCGVDHWEHLWSPRYIIDWILLLHEKGVDLNYHAAASKAKAVAHYAIHYFGSWDNALEKAGLDPGDIRRVEFTDTWSRDAVITALQELAGRRKKDPGEYMSNRLRNAIRRHFKNTRAAIRASGLKKGDVTGEKEYTDAQENALVRRLEKLEGMKGRERWKNWRSIKKQYKKLINVRYGSLPKMARARGIPSRSIARSIYRDAEDIHHDLDLLEAKGRTLTYRTVKSFSPALYDKIIGTGWGYERVVHSISNRRLERHTPRRHGKC